MHAVLFHTPVFQIVHPLPALFAIHRSEDGQQEDQERIGEDPEDRPSYNNVPSEAISHQEKARI